MEGGGSKGGKKGGRKEEVEWGQSREGWRERERRRREGQDEQSVREKRRKNSVYWICKSQACAVTYRPYYLLTQPFNHIFCKTGVIYKPSSAYRLSVLHTAHEKKSAGEAKHWIVYTFIYLLVWTVVNMENTERPSKRCNINKNDSCCASETLIAFKVRKMYCAKKWNIILKKSKSEIQRSKTVSFRYLTVVTLQLELEPAVVINNGFTKGECLGRHGSAQIFWAALSVC